MARFQKKQQILKVIRKDLHADFYKNIDEEKIIEIEEFLESGVLRHINVPLLARRSDLFPAKEGDQPLHGFINIGNVVGYDSLEKKFKVEIFEKFSDFIESADFHVFASIDLTYNIWKITRLNVYIPRIQEPIEDKAEEKVDE